MKLTVKPRLNILVLEKKIRTATNFARAMTAAGYKLSTSQAARYLNEDPPPSMSVEFIEKACTVFQCMPNDLFDLTLLLEPEETVDPLLALPHHAKLVPILRTSKAEQSSAEAEAPSARRKLPWEDEFGVAGPGIKPLPSPKKK